MFDQFHYFPLVKWKRAERMAISLLDPTVKSKITPIIEIIPIPRDLDTGEQTKNLEDHVGSASKTIETAWGKDDLFYLDCEEISADQSSDGHYGPSYMFAQAADSMLEFVPVIGLQRDAVQISAALNHSRRGICIRLTLDDFEKGTLQSDISLFLETHRLEAAQVDLILDLGSIEDQRLVIVREIARQFVESIPQASMWRTLIMLASAFPRDMGVVSKNDKNHVPRVEWLMWKQLMSRDGRLPNFGDYGIQHPAGVEDFDPRYMTPSATIRYTSGDNWLLIKGESMKKKGGEQFRQLSGILVQEPDYYGPQHCAGCLGISDCSLGNLPAKSLEVWRRLGTTHHFTVITEQLNQIPLDKGVSFL